MPSDSAAHAAEGVAAEPVKTQVTEEDLIMFFKYATAKEVHDIGTRLFPNDPVRVAQFESMGHKMRVKLTMTDNLKIWVMMYLVPLFPALRVIFAVLIPVALAFACAFLMLSVVYCPDWPPMDMVYKSWALLVATFLFIVVA